MQHFIKYFLLWIPMLFIAILNGAARDLWYKKIIGELNGLQLSTLTLIILLGFYIRAVLKKYPADSVTESLKIGLLWLSLTLLFEFGFGLIRGKSWAVMLHDYNIFEGRTWVLVLIWVALAPYVFYKANRQKK